MTYTMAEASLALARVLDYVKDGTASADGNAGGTTLVDTTRTEANDTFNGGTLWVTSGTYANKTGVITDWVLSTGTVTIGVAVGGKILSGVTYSILDNTFPRDVLRQAINQALRELPLPAQNTAITLVANQESYDLPSGVCNIDRVEIATSTTTPYNYALIPRSHWYEQDDKLYFHTGHQPSTTSVLLRVWYTPNTTDLTTDAGTISDNIHIDLLKWQAAIYATRMSLQQKRGDDKFLAALLAEAIGKSREMKMLHPLPRIQKQAPTARWLSGATEGDDEIGEPGKVRV